MGSTLARVAWGAFGKAALELKRDGRLSAAADALPYAELDALFTKR